MTSRNYVFTINNPVGLLDFTGPKGIGLRKGLRYATYQEESGRETGTHHFQGYMELSEPMRIAAIKKWPGFEGAHLEPRRGTREQARIYCTPTKGGDVIDPTYVDGPYEIGEFGTNQGSRSDLAALYEDLKNGESDLQLLDKYPAQFMRMYRGISVARLLRAGRRDWKSEVHVYFGPPGAGKSRWAHEHYPNAYWKSGKNKWWDQYQGEPDVIWDEFGPGSSSYSDLLRILDRYPMLVETKGGSVNFAARTIIITANSLPNLWFNYDEKRMFMSAVTRRIDVFVLFGPARQGREIDERTPLQVNGWEELQAIWPMPLLPPKKNQEDFEE